MLTVTRFTRCAPANLPVSFRFNVRSDPQTAFFLVFEPFFPAFTSFYPAAEPFDRAARRFRRLVELITPARGSVPPPCGTPPSVWRERSAASPNPSIRPAGAITRAGGAVPPLRGILPSGRREHLAGVIESYVRHAGRVVTAVRVTRPGGGAITDLISRAERAGDIKNLPREQSGCGAVKPNKHN
jgi:hypothetical protein